MELRMRCAAAAVLFLLSSCSSDDDNGASSVVDKVAESDDSNVSESDVRLIVDLWEHLERSSEGGLERWGEAVVDSQYPGSGATFDVCTHGVTSRENFRVAYEIERSSIEPAPEWTVPDLNPTSPMSGETPVGRTYSMTVRTSFGGSPAVHETAQFVTVRDGEAFWFPICETE